VETDLSEWPDFEGEIPVDTPCFMIAIVNYMNVWKPEMDNDVPALEVL
jgi:hypothetical protein